MKTALQPDPALAIDVRGVTKRFGSRTVVDAIDLRIPHGSIFGFLGPNGSGKTTFIRMLCGLLEPTAGEGFCLGYDILRQRPQIKREVGYMTQKFSYYEDLSVRENLEFVAHIYGMPGRRRLIDDTLASLGLEGRGRQLAGTLSGGWKQRLALAACLLHKPRLLLLDEPTAGVDPKARRDFWDEIHRLSRSGLTVLVTTHYMDEAERCSDLAYLAYGKLLVTGTVRDLVEKSGLLTYRITGPRLLERVAALRGLPGVAQVAMFGAAVHVSGHDPAVLEGHLADVLDASCQWQREETSLEDVFIHLMSAARDNFSN